jgi:hypothetical protein
MPTATITIDAGVAGTMTDQKTISGADLTRFVAAVRVAYNVPASFTDIQALQVWADFVFQQARDTTRGVEQASASAGIGSIALT